MKPIKVRYLIFIILVFLLLTVSVHSQNLVINGGYYFDSVSDNVQKNETIAGVVVVQIIAQTSLKYYQKVLLNNLKKNMILS